MLYKLLADAVLVFHLIWIAILIGGSWFSFKHKWYRPIHKAVIITTGTSQIIWMGCPLTTLEGMLRRQYNPAHNYSGSFVVYYLHEYIGIDVSPMVVTCSLGAIAAIAFVTFILPRVRREES